MSRKQYLYDNTPVDKILQEREHVLFTEFVCKCGGDISMYRVYGDNINNYKIIEK